MVEIVPELAGRCWVDLKKLQSLQSHPHLLQCYEIGRIREGDWQGAWFIFWEAWDYRLADRRPVGVRQGRLGSGYSLMAQEYREIAKQIAKGLARFHAAGLVHGDVRPERICRVNNAWKLMPRVLNGCSSKGKVGAEATPADDMLALGQAG